MVDILRQEAEKWEGPAAYVEFLREQYNQSPLASEMLRKIAGYLQATDPALGVDETYPTSWAFYKGALLGMRVVEAVCGPEFFERIRNTTIQAVDPTKATDPRQLVYQQASIFIQTGSQGYQSADVYHELFEAWEDELVPDVRTQMFVKYGFGYVHSLAQRAMVQADLEAMQIGIESTDWDAEFANLLNPPQ